MARALAHRNYRLFFVGQGISLIGTWMTRVATGWLVFRLSGPDSAFLLGIMRYRKKVPEMNGTVPCPHSSYGVDFLAMLSGGVQLGLGFGAGRGQERMRFGAAF